VICLIVAGKLFHTCGSAKAKLLSPRVFCRKMSRDDDDHAQRRVDLSDLFAIFLTINNTITRWVTVITDLEMPAVAG